MKQWLTFNKLIDHKLKTKVIIDDWPLIIKQVEQGAGYALIPDSFPIDDKKVFTIKVPNRILPAITIYLLQREESSALLPVKKVFRF